MPILMSNGTGEGGRGTGKGVPAIHDACSEHCGRLGRVERPNRPLPRPPSFVPQLVSEPGLLSLRVPPRRHHDRVPQLPLRQPSREHGHHLAVAHAVQPRCIRRDRSPERTAHLIDEPRPEHRVHPVGDAALERVARQREMNVPRTHRAGRARVLLPPAQAASGEERDLDRARGTGRGVSGWEEDARATGSMRPWYIHLTLPRDALERRIADRVDTMLGAGLVDEVRRTLGRPVAPDAPGLDGVGYREVVAMLAGRLPERELRDAIVVATRRYAKRQETWFRNQLRDEGRGTREGSIWTLDATEAPTVLTARIVDRWHAFTRPSSPLPRPV